MLGKLISGLRQFNPDLHMGIAALVQLEGSSALNNAPLQRKY